eukprot:TRINITY_DN6755_c0_g2_i1.p1 TRINITY_DN6755_c0_g2~~TRINITY_DN6755_c0_g2_i1.p1  ORF type:complete len:742 (-),score=136.43 TRINITY_DN6755_c0_g2_i1:12-2237(-)
MICTRYPVRRTKRGLYKYRRNSRPLRIPETSNMNVEYTFRGYARQMPQWLSEIKLKKSIDLKGRPFVKRGEPLQITEENAISLALKNPDRVFEIFHFLGLRKNGDLLRRLFKVVPNATSPNGETSLDLVVKYLIECDDADALFEFIQLPDLPMTNYTFYFDVISYAAEVQHLEMFKYGLNHIRARIGKYSLLVYNMIVTLYANMVSYQQMEIVFEAMEEHGIKWDADTYNCLLTYHINNNEPEKIDDVLNQMNDNKLRANTNTCNILLEYYVSTSEIEKLKNMLDIASNIEWDNKTVALVIRSYAVIGDFTRSMDLFFSRNNIGLDYNNNEIIEGFLWSCKHVNAKKTFIKISEQYIDLLGEKSLHLVADGVCKFRCDTSTIVQKLKSYKTSKSISKLLDLYRCSIDRESINLLLKEILEENFSLQLPIAYYTKLFVFLGNNADHEDVVNLLKIMLNSEIEWSSTMVKRFVSYVKAIKLPHISIIYVDFLSEYISQVRDSDFGTIDEYNGLLELMSEHKRSEDIMLLLAIMKKNHIEWNINTFLLMVVNFSNQKEYGSVTALLQKMDEKFPDCWNNEILMLIEERCDGHTNESLTTFLDNLNEKLFTKSLNFVKNQAIKNYFTYKSEENFSALLEIVGRNQNQEIGELEALIMKASKKNIDEYNQLLEAYISTGLFDRLYKFIKMSHPRVKWNTNTIENLLKIRGPISANLRNQIKKCIVSFSEPKYVTEYYNTFENKQAS